MYGQGRIFQPSYTYRGVLKKSRTWRIEFWVNGKPRREAVSVKKSDAQAKLKERIGQAGTGELLPSDISATTYDDLKKLIIDDYIANGRVLKPLHDALKRLDASFAGMKATDIAATWLTGHKTRNDPNAELMRAMSQ